ncbi:MAG: S8 family serine peptidase [Longimicrobiales bacterium]
MTTFSCSLDHPLFAGRTGHGIRVAVLDSGIHPGNPHVGRATAGVYITPDGETDDALDRLGHGTAVAAAILEKAPGIELVVVRVFDRTLATSAAVLARAIEWAADHECRLINLSLGTPNAERAAMLGEAVALAAARGALVVSARELDGVRWFPGCLENVAGVSLDHDCARDELRVSLDPADQTSFRASGLPRPIPGVPTKRNVRGISFAVANTTGFLARLFEAFPELRTPRDIAHHVTSQHRPVHRRGR